MGLNDEIPARPVTERCTKDKLINKHHVHVPRFNTATVKVIRWVSLGVIEVSKSLRAMTGQRRGA